MHRLPSIFSRNSDGRKDRIHSSSSRQASKPKRLDRCNAMKNIDYESSPSTSASSSSSSSKESLRRRSMNLYGDRPSFRVDGTDGEFEIICQTYGFSGIDDFSVSPEEYEAMKVRSSSVPAVFNQKLERVNYQKSEVDCDGSAQFSCDRGVHVISRNMEDNDKYGGFSDNSSDIIDGRKFEEGRHFGYMDRSWVNDFSIGVSEQSKSFGNGLRVNDVISVDTTSRRSNAVHKNGVMGMQPPVLVPPPLMMLPVIKKESSTHDKSGGFLFNSETCVSGPERGFCLDEDEKGGQNRTEQEKHMRRRTIAREGKHVLLEPYYFTTAWNDDDDSWSTTKEPLSNVPPNGKYTRVIEDWQKGELLGCGSFGSVYEGIADDGFFFAVKEVSLLDQGDEGKHCITQLEQEISLLSQFDHSNIVQYYGTKKDESHLYIFLELVTKGSLLSIYQKYELRVPQVSAYTRQILHGLKYLHDRNVVHRDIKCANILVDTNGSVKLADFGLAKATKLNDLKSCKGTAFWMAPEVVRSNRYGRAADIWSLGCTVLEMLTRRFPYSNMEWMSALLSIGKGEGPLIPDSLSSDARAFIHNCLQVNPSLRPTAAQLLDHPFVKRPLSSSSGTLSPHSFSRRI